MLKQKKEKGIHSFIQEIFIKLLLHESGTVPRIAGGDGCLWKVHTAIRVTTVHTLLTVHCVPGIVLKAQVKKITYNQHRRFLTVLTNRSHPGLSVHFLAFSISGSSISIWHQNK